MAWTNLTFSFGQVLTSSQMTQLDDNFEALAEGVSGAPKMTGESMDYALKYRLVSNDVTSQDVASVVVTFPTSFSRWRIELDILTTSDHSDILLAQYSDDGGTSTFSDHYDYTVASVSSSGANFLELTEEWPDPPGDNALNEGKHVALEMGYFVAHSGNNCLHYTGDTYSGGLYNQGSRAYIGGFLEVNTDTWDSIKFVLEQGGSFVPPLRIKVFGMMEVFP